MLSQLTRGHARHFEKNAVEGADAAKATGHGDLGERGIGGGDQHLRAVASVLVDKRAEADMQ